MLWYHATAMLMLFNVAFGFPRGKTTEKPEIPVMESLVPPKNRKLSTQHISEFTDPDTGLNPFLDLEEGPTSVGRNVMEDERRDDDAPYFDLDLVEGDAPSRNWGLEEPKEPVSRVPARRPAVEFMDEIEIPFVTTQLHIPNPPTTVEISIAMTTEAVKIESNKSGEGIQHVKGEKESFIVSQSTVIYASATIAAVATLILLIGACWWRRKLKTPQSTATVENGEVKS